MEGWGALDIEGMLIEGIDLGYGLRRVGVRVGMKY